MPPLYKIDLLTDDRPLAGPKAGDTIQLPTFQPDVRGLKMPTGPLQSYKVVAVLDRSDERDLDPNGTYVRPYQISLEPADETDTASQDTRQVNTNEATDDDDYIKACQFQTINFYDESLKRPVILLYVLGVDGAIHEFANGTRSRSRNLSPRRLAVARQGLAVQSVRGGRRGLLAAASARKFSYAKR
jgi:hypothetical protein